MPEEKKETGKPRIGIFVCECGGNIGDVVDVKAVVEAVKNWEGVAVAKYTNICVQSQPKK